MKYSDEFYGLFTYGEGELEKGRDVKPVNLMDYLPLYYRDSRVMTSMQDSISKQYDGMNAAIAEIQGQLYVDTAGWGLGLWESELGILTNKYKSMDYRRNVIKSKLQGAQITTPVLIEDIGEIFSGGRADVTDFPMEYRFIVKFIGTRGIPPNMPELTKAIEMIKPAHLAFSYEYTYCVWEEAATYTWESAKFYTWDGFHIAKPRTLWTSSKLTRWDDFYLLTVRPSWKYAKKMTWEEFQLLKSNS